ncbi:hypothetical protein [Veronia nyctiphanis]|uniref:hypothetical protein n=1 Tax=Veronia nyctiphanis TaxID=1278244 RepID=UPI001F2FDE8A|nr:hypothetical protein [Veronia nyctiphanis]
MTDKSVYLCEQVLEAIDTKSQLNLVGGNSKHFMGRAPTGKTLNIGDHHGIVDYQPLNWSSQREPEHQYQTLIHFWLKTTSNWLLNPLS